MSQRKDFIRAIRIKMRIQVFIQMKIIAYKAQFILDRVAVIMRKSLLINILKMNISISNRKNSILELRNI
jgi:hypothetical protein